MLGWERQADCTARQLHLCNGRLLSGVPHNTPLPPTSPSHTPLPHLSHPHPPPHPPLLPQVTALLVRHKAIDCLEAIREIDGVVDRIMDAAGALRLETGTPALVLGVLNIDETMDRPEERGLVSEGAGDGPLFGALRADGVERCTGGVMQGASLTRARWWLALRHKHGRL